MGQNSQGFAFSLPSNFRNEFNFHNHSLLTKSNPYVGNDFCDRKKSENVFNSFLKCSKSGLGMGL